MPSSLSKAGSGDSVPQMRSSVTPSVGPGVNYEVRLSADQKDFNLVMHPVYQTLRSRPNANLSVVPGGN